MCEEIGLSEEKTGFPSGPVEMLTSPSGFMVTDLDSVTLNAPFVEITASFIQVNGCKEKSVSAFCS